MADLLARLQSALADRYTIERELGAGGMATVYLAHDLRHDRQVALKVLRPELAASLGSDRFLREIKTTARLTHPHILPLHDSGEAEGFLYYVMPYVAGETLRDRLAREKQLPLDDALQITREVADALGYAHALGLVHRDIKPENILFEAGHAVVSDFGIAKAIAAAGSERLTETGLAIGTPRYMSPEQAAGSQDLDGRSDLYSLGCVLYEMLSGETPYTGPSAQAILAKKLSEPLPRISVVREAVPAGIEAALTKALARTPADRFVTAAEFAAVLAHPGAMVTPSGGTTPTQVRPSTAIGRLPRWAKVAGVAAMFLAWALWRWLSPAEPTWELANIRQVTQEPELELYPALSPDGREVAYAAGYAGSMHIYVRDVSGGRALPLTADRAGVQEPVTWLAGGQRILVRSSDGSFVVPRMGGPAEPIRGTPIRGGGAWGFRSDSVLYQRGESLFVGAADGTWESFLVAAPGLHSAAWSPDGSRVAFVDRNFHYIQANFWGNRQASSIWTVSVHGGPAVLATDSNSKAFHESPAWLPDGRHLVVVSNRDRSRDLYVVRLRADGRPQGALRRLTTGLEPHTVSMAADGKSIAYSRLIFRSNLFRVALPRSGSVSIRDASPVTTGSQVVENEDLSRDGKWLAFDSDREGHFDIYVMPAAGGEPRRLTKGPGEHYSPNFSPDGSEIAFYSTRFGQRNLFIMKADGTGQTRLTSDSLDDYHPKFSPDGLRIAFFRARRYSSEIFMIRRDSVGGPWSAPEQLTHSGGSSGGQRWSPDGRRLVYSNERGISVLTLGGAERLVADFASGRQSFAVYPNWSQDGRAILFGAASRDGSAGIFEVRSTGGRPRLIVRFDDPARAVLFTCSTVGPGRIDLAVSEYESDVYVAELRRR